ncbi:hypothetical protein GGR57DRAFT_3565 [Xylariaceae sp. FL1272]|nr:hypothetical protein GGR57DRAFT_3565 [Xylariaceae sp. FL1272]
MLVYLQEPNKSAISLYQNRPKLVMAPQSSPSSTLIFDSRTQIIDNCEFVLSKDDIITVITSRDPNDKFFKSYAVRCNEDVREVVLESSPCATAQEATESLHTKSCEAIHNYITTNGFANPRVHKMTFIDDAQSDLDDDAASIISGHSDSSTVAFSDWAHSDDEATMALQEQHAPRTNGKNKPAGAGDPVRDECCMAADKKRASRSQEAPSKTADLDVPSPPRASRVIRPPPDRVHSPSPQLASRQPPPPPPPGWAGPPARPPSMRGMPPNLIPPGPQRTRQSPPLPPNLYQQHTRIPHQCRPQNGPLPTQPVVYFPGLNPPGHSRGCPPPPASQGQMVRKGMRPNPSPCNGFNPVRGPSVAASSQFRTVRLKIHWLRHGIHRIVAVCQANIRALEDAAMAHVRGTPEAFLGGSDRPQLEDFVVRKGDLLENVKGFGTRHLRACVCRVIFSNDTSCDMRGFRGEDLSSFFGSDIVPCFEVVVESLEDEAIPDDVSETSQGTGDLTKDEDQWD